MDLGGIGQFAKMLVSLRILKGANPNDREDMLQVATLAGWRACKRCNRDGGCLGERCLFVRKNMNGAIIDFQRSVDPLTRGHRSAVRSGKEHFHQESIDEPLEIYDKGSKRDGGFMEVAGHSPDCVMTVSLRECVKRLAFDERAVVLDLYFSEQDRVTTAKRFMVTRGRLSQIESKALGHLAECLGIK